MGDRVMVDALSKLRRRWWFCGIEGLRDGDRFAAYSEFDLDEQPNVAPQPSLEWLEHAPDHAQWAIADSDAVPSHRLTMGDLTALVPGHLALPASLRVLAQRRHLQRRIRSATGCYLDLGDRLVSTSAEGGVLLHLLSDQQWVRHWLVYFDMVGNDSVITTPEPIGFVPTDGRSEGMPEVIPLDGSLRLDVCADSIDEFLFRLWVESELYFAPGDSGSPAKAAYRKALLDQRGESTRRG